MKKVAYFILLSGLLTIFSISCLGQPDSIDKKRALLKDYFFYCCLKQGFNDIDIAKYDHSGVVYIELLPYSYEAYAKVDSLAKVFIDSIEYSDKEGRNTRGIIILCLEKYKSQQLDDYIKTMDEFIIHE